MWVPRFSFRGFYCWLGNANGSGMICLCPFLSWSFIFRVILLEVICSVWWMLAPQFPLPLFSSSRLRVKRKCQACGDYWLSYVLFCYYLHFKSGRVLKVKLAVFTCSGSSVYYYLYVQVKNNLKSQVLAEVLSAFFSVNLRMLKSRIVLKVKLLVFTGATIFLIKMFVSIWGAVEHSTCVTGWHNVLLSLLLFSRRDAC